jgi:predicted RNA-binding protein associated with RNAse of E/G family
VSLPLVQIHYRRPPAREDVYEQKLVHDSAEVRITLARKIGVRGPLVVDGEVALEAGSDVVWFTFPGKWHDIGRFHRADGTFTGVYSNILTPPVFEPGEVWRTTDLFLDVWVPPSGRPRVLDRDEFEEAVQSGWIDGATSARALEEVERIVAAAAAGAWPPGIVQEWTLGRARLVEESGR